MPLRTAAVKCTASAGGNLSDAKKPRTALLPGVTKGRHTGTRATLDDLFAE
jgi:hypothetical protein